MEDRFDDDVIEYADVSMPLEDDLDLDGVPVNFNLDLDGVPWGFDSLAGESDYDSDADTMQTRGAPPPSEFSDPTGSEYEDSMIDNDDFIPDPALPSQDPLPHKSSSPLHGAFANFFALGKRARQHGSDEEDKVVKEKPKKKKGATAKGKGKGKEKIRTSDEPGQARALGTSRSATAARAATAAVQAGTFVLNAAKYENWKAKILAISPDCMFDLNRPADVFHTPCKMWLKVSEPYRVSHFQAHMKTCPGRPRGRKAHTKTTPHQGPTLLNFFTPLERTAEEGGGVKAAKEVTEEDEDRERLRPQQPARKPCPGLTPEDNARIATYLARMTALGGGGCSITKIAKAFFGKLYRLLVAKKQQFVRDTQAHEQTWTNDHDNKRVFSRACLHSTNQHVGEPPRPLPCLECRRILTLPGFRAVLNRPIPLDVNYKYLNKQFRHELLGDQYAKIRGLRELLEAVCSPAFSAYCS